LSKPCGLTNALRQAQGERDWLVANSEERKGCDQ
jgi:hypothetical protein